MLLKYLLRSCSTNSISINSFVLKGDGTFLCRLSMLERSIRVSRISFRRKTLLTPIRISIHKLNIKIILDILADLKMNKLLIFYEIGGKCFTLRYSQTQFRQTIRWFYSGCVRPVYKNLSFSCSTDSKGCAWKFQSASDLQLIVRTGWSPNIQKYFDDPYSVLYWVNSIKFVMRYQRVRRSVKVDMMVRKPLLIFCFTREFTPIN